MEKKIKRRNVLLKLVKNINKQKKELKNEFNVLRGVM